jgi:mRNA-degrading endonuclease toxin of MazEF toxin-antitoxin module
MNAKPGDIWLADLGLAAKTRPVLIISGHGMKGELSIGKW